MFPRTMQRSSARTNTNRVCPSNQSKQMPSSRSEEAERVSTNITLAWFSRPALLRVTIDSRQNRTECHYEDLFLYTHYVMKV